MTRKMFQLAFFSLSLLHPTHHRENHDYAFTLMDICFSTKSFLSNYRIGGWLKLLSLFWIFNDKIHTHLSLVAFSNKCLLLVFWLIFADISAAVVIIGSTDINFGQATQSQRRAEKKNTHRESFVLCSTSKPVIMENQGKLMVNCMLLAIQRFQLSANNTSNNNNVYNNTVNVTWPSTNFSTFDNQSTVGDSLDNNNSNNSHDLQLADQLIPQWVQSSD